MKKIFSIFLSIVLGFSMLTFLPLIVTANNNINVPFISQNVPYGGSDGWSGTMNCGQTCCVMIEAFFKGTSATTQRIMDVDDWLEANKGLPKNSYRGSGTDCTILKSVLKDYMGFNDVTILNSQTIQNIKNFLDGGKPVIVWVTQIYDPYNVGNAYSYEDHFIVAKGYDNDYFYFNDPGRNSSVGPNAKYSFSKLEEIWVKNQGCVVVNSGTTATVPPTPTGFNYTSKTETTVNLSWNSSAGATSYNVYKNSVYYGWTSSTSCQINGLTQNTSYAFNVTAVNSAGESSKSSTVNVTTYATQPKVPPAPTGLAYTSKTETSVNLSWGGSSGATGYYVYKNNARFNSSPTSGTSLNVTGLTQNTNYSFNVTAVNSAGESGKSSTVSVTTNATQIMTPTLNSPADATQLQLNTSTNFNWYSTGAPQYQILFTNPSGSDTPINVTGQTNVNFSPNASGTWHWKVISKNSAGVQYGSWSSSRSFTVPGAPPAGIFTIQYYNTDLLTGNIVYTETANEINKNWGSSSPKPGTVNTDSFSARFTGTVNFEQGYYKFHYDADDSCKVKVDNTYIVDNMGPNAVGDGGINLSAGNHTVVVEYGERTGDARVLVNWTKTTPPNPTGTFTINYYNTDLLTGNIVYTETANEINKNWGSSSPKPGTVNTDSFSARFTGTVNFEQGYYKFHYDADDSCKVKVDSNYIVDNMGPNAVGDSGITLTAGNHTIVVEYGERTGDARVLVNWTKTTEPVPDKFVVENGVLTKYNGTDVAVTIPNNLGITKIGVAFCANTNITSVTIPTGVTVIGNSAFLNCTNLTSVILPYGVTTIEVNAFRSCEKLATIEIPSSVRTIANFTFTFCNTLTEVIIPEGVTSIGMAAFTSCSNLTKIVIPRSVTTLGNPVVSNWTTIYGYSGSYAQTFANTNSIPFVDITPKPPAAPTGLICTGKTDTTVDLSWNEVPGGLVYYVFKDSILYNPGLPIEATSYHVTGLAQNTTYSFTVMAVNNAGASLASAPLNVTTYYKDFIIENNVLVEYTGPGGSVTIPTGVTGIGDWAFYNCLTLTNVTVPSTVTSIGNSTFQGCSALIGISMQNNITSIGDWAFVGCSSLASITVPTGIASLGLGAFQECSGLKNVTIPGNVKSIGTQAFYDCTGLTDVTISSGVVSFGYLTFGSCTSLIKITIPTSVTIIDVNAFRNGTSATIYGYGGSYAQTFASNNSIPFVDLAPTPPSVPTGLIALSKSDTTVNLSWNASTSATGYNVYRGTTKLTATPITETVYTATGLTQNTNYSFTVKAVNAIYESAASLPYSVTTCITPTLPLAPTGLSSPNKTDTTVNLSWTASPDPLGYPVYGYNVYRGTTKLTATPITLTNYTASGLTQNTNYSFTIKAVNVVGESPASLALSVTTNVTPTIPLAPTGLSAPIKTDTTVNLSWAASANTTGYNVYSGTTKLTAAPITATTYTATGLTQNTAYSFTVKAVNAVGESPASTALIVTTNISISITATPTATTSGSVTVTITYPAYAVIKEYKLNAGNWTSYTAPVVLTSNNTVSARCKDAAGNYSSIISIIISNIDSTPPNTPILAATPTTPTNGNVTVTITYPADANIKQYKIGYGAWTAYTEAVVLSANDTVYARCIDSVGNYSNLGSLVIDNIDKIAPATPTLTATPTTQTNGNVTITITYPDDANLKEFKIGSGDWTAYNSAVIITANDAVYARCIDLAGNVSDTGSIIINNISDIVRITNNGTDIGDIFSVKVPWYKAYKKISLQLGFATNDRDYTKVEWSSDNSKVLVDQTGKITNIKTGARSAKITVKLFDNNNNVIVSDSVKIIFYKYKWQLGKLQSQSIVSDSYAQRNMSVQELETLDDEGTIEPGGSQEGMQSIIAILTYVITVLRNLAH